MLAFLEFQEGLYSVARMRPDGSGYRQLQGGFVRDKPWVPNLFPVRWSGDGAQIGFTARTEDGTSLIAVDLKGNAREIVPPINLIMDMEWAPDAQTIAFTGRFEEEGPIELIVVDTQTLETRVLATNVWDLDWSPDGLWIAFSSSGAIHVSNPEGTTQWQVSQAGTWWGDFAPEWGPDSQRILFVRGLDFTGYPPREEIWITDLEGQEPRQLVSIGGENVNTPVWSSDGRKFAHRRETGDSIYVVVSNLRGEQVDIHSGYSADWKPETRELAMARSWDDMWITKKDRTKEKFIGNGLAPMWRPCAPSG